MRRRLCLYRNRPLREFSGANLNLLIDGGGVHQVLVHFIELERLTIVLDDDVRGPAGPHEIP